MESTITQMRAIKRNGEMAPLDIDKIKQVIAWASDGLDLNPLELEARVSTVFKDGISTREIQDNLINQALTLTSIEEPNWRIVAGRLLMMNYWKETKLARGEELVYEDYVQFVHRMVTKGAYGDVITREYSDELLREAATWINPKLDLLYDYAGAVALKRRYLIENELPQEAYLTISLLLAVPERAENRMVMAKRFYDVFSQRKLSLATPILRNLRRPNGNLSSCFITAMGDSLESISGVWTQCGKISKNGGGVGVNLTKVRGRNSWVNGQAGASGGVVPWIKIVNDIAVAVNQGGARAGAITVSIDNWHIDMPDFLQLQTENGDPRLKARDVFPQVVVTDEFMRRVKENADWTLMDPYEVKRETGIDLAELWGESFTTTYRWLEEQNLSLSKKVKARELFKEVMKTQIETGMPYIFFKDTANRANPNKHCGYIPSANLCVESYSNVKADEEVHTCNLVSPNLANIEDDELADVCYLSVRVLDNTIDITTTPIEQSAVHNNLYRTIGVGAMGFADWLAKRGIPYMQSADIADKLFEQIGYYCTKASAELAVERGAYPRFEGSDWSKGVFFGREVRSLDFGCSPEMREKWIQLADFIAQHGIRNSQISAIAPNTSSAIVQMCTPSVLPIYSKFYYEKNANGAVPICPPFLKGNFWTYQENKNIDQRIVVDVTSRIQKWIDTGISMELLFNLNAEHVDAKHIFDTIVEAHEKGCKAIYYVRSIQKDGKVSDKDACVSCAN